MLPMPPSDAELYMRHLASLGSARPKLAQIPGDQPPILSIAFENTPDAGYTTGFTYGLSLTEHAHWPDALRPELMLTVQSTNSAWQTLAAVIAEGMRGASSFTYGATIDYGAPVAPDTAMSAFFCFAPLILEEQTARLQAASYAIQLVQLYPIYEGEVALIHRIGLEAFFRDERIDFLNLSRPDFT